MISSTPAAMMISSVQQQQQQQQQQQPIQYPSAAGKNHKQQQQQQQQSSRAAAAISHWPSDPQAHGDWRELSGNGVSTFVILYIYIMYYYMVYGNVFHIQVTGHIIFKPRGSGGGHLPENP